MKKSLSSSKGAGKYNEASEWETGAVSGLREGISGDVSRRDALGLIGKTSLVALLASACRIDPPVRPVADPTRPNIVYIHSHDTGRYIEPYGHYVSTPNLQQFADEGMLFRQAFSASPTCSPARASLMTGMTPGCNGMWGLAHKGWNLNDYSQTLIPFLKKAGYTTALVGVQHIFAHRDPRVCAEKLGYNTLPKIRGGRLAEPVADAAVSYLNSALEQPFFLDIGFAVTHAFDMNPAGSYFGYENGDTGSVDIPPNLEDTAETRRDMADFAVAATALDKAIGRILATLEQRGLAEKTLVMITTDRSVPLPGMKCNHTDGGLGVSLMFRGPKEFSGGKVSNALVSHLDVFPTFCELLELPEPAWLQGTSLMPLVRGEVDEINEAVFAEHEIHVAPEPQASVRTKRYKYIRRLDGYDEPRPANTDQTYTKTLWLGRGWDAHLLVPKQLYDLSTDPEERRNLAADPEHKAVLSDMRGLMVARMNKYDNPLLRKYNVADAPPEKKALPVTPQFTPLSSDGYSEIGVIYTD